VIGHSLFEAQVLFRARTILLALSLAACSAPASATDASIPDAARVDAGPALVVVSVVDLGALPHPSDTVVGRDGASSGVIDGQLLWTFGDTFVSMTTPVDGSNVVTATGAWSTPADPLVLEQPVDDHGIPSQLIPYTDAELEANRLSAINGWALWPGAVIDTGGPDLLVLFQRIKRTDGSGFDGVGLGTARIAPHETVARRDPDDLFSRPMPPATGGDPLYGTGGVSVIGETVYFFACEIGGCRVGRTPRARADERAAFEFYDGTAWVADIDAAVVVIRNVGAATSVTYNAHLGRFLSVTSRAFSNDVVLRTAEHVEGPWPTTGVTIAPSDGGILAAGEGNDYLAQEHVALSAADGTEIVISYARPLGSFRGEVRLARITLE
jgi:hypothetical protein